MAISTRSDAFALKEESTAGVPVAPAAATDFIAVQEGSSISTTFETLENNEKTGTIGSAEPSLGLETSEVSLEHYARASGVEGQAPNWHLLPKSLFGSEISGLTERDTVAASTTTTINVDAGEGPEFGYGRPVLIKDSTNGYSIRWSTGDSGDSFDLNFAVDAAPGAGVLLGDPVYWEPTNDGHPTLTAWNYKGNIASGAVQMAAGCRVSSMDINADAGGYINGSFSLTGTEGFYNPIEITASTRYIDFSSDNVTDQPVALPIKYYKDPHDLAEAVAAGLNAADPLETYACSYDNSTGKFTIATSTSFLFELLWNTGTNAANTAAAKLGFSAAADDTGSTSYLADNAQDYSAPFTPTFDDNGPAVARANSVRFGDQADNVCFDATTIGVNISNALVDINSICAETGRKETAVSSRTDAITLTAFVENYDADKWHRYHTNQDTAFMWTWGEKDSSGNWVPGKAMSFWAPRAKISEFSLDETDSLLIVNMTLTPYVKDGQAEVFLAQL